MSEEPEYLRQHGGFSELTPDERWAWFDSCAVEARAEGATFFRASVDNAENPTMALVEGWKKQPRDQGPIRWQMTLAEVVA